VSIIEQPKLSEIAGNSTRITRPSIRLFDAILQGRGFANALIVGLVIGAGIFETPALVAANANSKTDVLQAWGLGGAISIIGALCYAELATTYPNIGGSYDYLKRAFGRSIAILFAWARLSVIQTGSIALLAFVFGDYASQLLRLGTFSAGIYAALAIALLTTLNILGVWQDHHSTPTAAYLFQEAISLALVGLVTVTRDGFKTMVDYTAPIFWFFFLLSSISLLVLRSHDPDSPKERLRQRSRPFRVPLYPILPLLFCAACGYLLYSSLVFTGTGAIVGVVVVALGIPFTLRHRQLQHQ
jgi:amino acid transporter